MKQKDFIMNTASLKQGDLIDVKISYMNTNNKTISSEYIGEFIHVQNDRLLFISGAIKFLFFYTKIVSIRKIKNN